MMENYGPASGGRRLNHPRATSGDVLAVEFEEVEGEIDEPLAALLHQFNEVTPSGRTPQSSPLT